MGASDYQLREYLIPVFFPDIAAASSIYIPIYWDGELVEARLSNSVVVDTANAVITTSRLPLGVVGSALTITGTLTVLTAGSAVGKVTTVQFSGANRWLQRGDSIRMTSDGGPTTANPCNLTLLFRR